jgi:hypothetical protein
MVTTERYLSAMSNRWEGFGNTITPDLLTVWSIMADSYNAAIANPACPKWTMLNPETGTGKTQGSYVYLSLLGQEAIKAMSEGGEGDGAIFVARTRDQCEEAVETINSLAGLEIAITRHSDKTREGGRTTLDQVFTRPILIVTHEAFVRSVEKDKEGNFIGLWSSYKTWLGGQRKLTIVDEALTNVVDHFSLNMSELAALQSVTPHFIRSKFLDEVRVVRDIDAMLFDSNRDKMSSAVLYLAWEKGGYELPSILRWSEYEEEVIKNLQLRSKNETQTNTRIATIRDTFRSLEAITTSWAYLVTKKGEGPVMTSSRFRIPEDIPGPVILDATASQDVASILLGPDRCTTVAMPRSRNYSNVTLHVSRDGNGLGKSKMFEHRTKRSKALADFIVSKGDPDAQWLVVCHKDVETHVIKYCPPTVNYSTAYWGKIDGRNDWNQYNNAVIFGLSYRDDVWNLNTSLSIIPDVNEAEMVKAQNKQRKKLLENRALSADIIQAINRIRCRRVIDLEGNCPTADVWLLLPPNEHGDYILEAIKSEMPNINVVDWRYGLDGEGGGEGGEQTEATINSTEAAIAWVLSAKPGDYSVKTIAHRLGLTDDTSRSKFRKQMKNPKSALRTRLDALGVTIRGNGVKGPHADTILHRPYELSRAA